MTQTEQLACLGNASALAEVKLMNPKLMIRVKRDERGTMLIARPLKAKPGDKWKVLAR